MDKLYIFTAIVLQGIAFSVAAPTPSTCQGDILNITMVNCMTNNGFSMEDVQKFIPSSSGAFSFDANDLKMLCNKKNAYVKATQCIVDVFNMCQFDGIMMNYRINQTAQMMNMICDDPHFKMDCLTELTKEPLRLQACLTSKYDFAKEMETKTMQQVACESGKIGVQCAVDILKPCDEHTATVFSAAESLALPAVCDV